MLLEENWDDKLRATGYMLMIHVAYHLNGAIAGFRYGNLIRHTLTQNVRGLPDRSRDAYEGGGTHRFALDDSYDYDANGNVMAISDGLAGNLGDRDMAYDNLDRLTRATSKLFGGAGTTPTQALYTYDVLDNLTRHKSLASGNARSHYFCYNNKHQLAFIRSGEVCTGNTPSPAVTALEYDLNGNLSAKNAQAYQFDYGNRLRQVPGKERYWYDGHGRRVQSDSLLTGGQPIVSHYNQSGQLLYQQDYRDAKRYEYVYLGGSLVAQLETAHSAGSAAERVAAYQHTDALGSVVARSTPARTIARYHFEPYGARIKWSNDDRPGYTGHVMDAATGLSYMQQRYYDPMIGRFLSVDPVTAYGTGDMRLFNRYAYANNNPYKFTDPDGRNPLGIAFGVGAEVAYQMKIEGRSFSELDKSDIVVAGLIGAVAPGIGSAVLRAGRSAPQVAKGVKAINKLGEQSARTINRATKIDARINKNVEKVSATIGDVAATAGHAATGVLVKNLVQGAVNEHQGQSQVQSQNQTLNQSQSGEKPKPPTPPPPSRESLSRR